MYWILTFLKITYIFNIELILASHEGHNGDGEECQEVGHPWTHPQEHQYPDDRPHQL